MEKNPERHPQTLRKYVRTALLLGGVILVWACSCLILVFAYIAFIGTPSAQVDAGTLVTVLFGASSIALFVLSFLVALIAAVGWQSYKKDMKKMRKDIERIGNEFKGRVATILGYALGEMSLAPGSFDVGDKDRMEQAVAQCRAGYEYLKKIGGAAEILGLNNLIFYTCVLHEGEPDKGDENYILKEARRLRDVGEEHDSAMLRLTACRVFLVYDTAQEEKAEAQKTLRALLTRNSGISERERKEAKFYLEKYKSPWF